MTYMTRWRIGSLLALRWEDVHFEVGFALSQATESKGKRDQRIPLHPLVIEHHKAGLLFVACDPSGPRPAVAIPRVRQASGRGRRQVRGHEGPLWLPRLPQSVRHDERGQT